MSSFIQAKPTPFLDSISDDDISPIEILLDNIESRRHIALHKKNGNIIYAPLYTGDDAVISGTIRNNFQSDLVKQSYKARIELIGNINLFGVGKKGFNFVTIAKVLGEISRPNEAISFCFNELPKKYETYTGEHLEIQYILQATVTIDEMQELKQQQEIALHLPSPSPAPMNIFTIQIGVMEAVEVELDYKKTEYHLEECIVGRVKINLVHMEIKKIELYLIKVENYFASGCKSRIKDEVLKRVVLKSGQPRQGEIIPLKLPLSSLDLSPTMMNVEDKVSIRYYLTLGLIDSNERMFFRKVEITLRRAM